MKDNIISTILAIFIFLVIVCTVLLSLDLCGVIALPTKLSLKTYLPNTIAVASNGKEVIYYPDYDATGIQTLVGNDNDDNDDDDSNDGDYDDGRANLTQFINKDKNNEEDNHSYQFENNITDNSFYYNQLDTYGKTIYSALYSNLDNLKSGNYTIDFDLTFNELLQKDGGEKTLADAFQLSINALLLDHPEIFYLDVTKMYMYTESTTTIRGTTYRISIGPKDENSNYLSSSFGSKSDVLIAEDELNTLLYIIKSDLSGNVYSQIKQVHDYLIDNIVYDSGVENDLSHGIYGALVKKAAVCDGYTKAFKYILDNIGISCIEVCGMGTNSTGNTESHAWNDVLIDGNWYGVDVTWDDPIINGGSGILTDSLRYNYFLKGSDSFYSSHTEDGFIVENGEFKYPALSNSQY